MILDRMIAQMVEAAFREGWGTGYSAGVREDTANGFYWCDEERDWRESEAAQAIEAQRAETVKQGSVADESAVAESDAPEPGSSSNHSIEIGE